MASVKNPVVDKIHATTTTDKPTNNEKRLNAEDKISSLFNLTKQNTTSNTKRIEPDEIPRYFSTKSGFLNISGRAIKIPKLNKNDPKRNSRGIKLSYNQFDFVKSFWLRWEVL